MHDVFVRLKQVVYRGDNLGRELKLDFHIEGQQSTLRANISHGSTRSFDKLVARFTSADLKLSTNVMVLVEEIDKYSDYGAGTSRVNLTLAPGAPAEATVMAALGGSGGDYGKTAFLDLTFEFSLSRGSVTGREARSWHRRFRRRQDIPFDYPVNCCFARAHLMCDDLSGQGIGSRKIWLRRREAQPGPPATPAGPPLEPRDGRRRRVQFPPGSGNTFVWRYHVAPVVEVEQPGGGTEAMVMDPSLSSAPIPVERWIRRMGDPADFDVEYTDPEVLIKGGGTTYIDPKCEYTRDTLKRHINDRDTALTPP